MENSAPLTQPLEDELRGGDELTSDEDLKEKVKTPVDPDQDGTVSRQDAELADDVRRQQRDGEDVIAPVEPDDQS